MAMDADSLIAGSGPAGAMAAWALRNSGRVMVMDVGHTPGEPADGPLALSLKLRAPGMQFVTRGHHRLTPLRSQTFAGAVSLAKGGFANAWGAGVYRFDAGELAALASSVAEMAPHYDEVAAHIGISGAEDDLGPDFGRESELQPPLEIGPKAAALLAAYQRVRPPGVRLGHARLAALSRPFRGRPAYAYTNREMVEPTGGAVYNPATTIDELRAAQVIDYLPGWVARSFRETGAGVELEAESLTGERRTFRSRRLLLATGALNSARIVLASARDTSARLPILDNPMTILPLWHWSGLRHSQERESGMAQLNAVLDPEEFGERYQLSIYGTSNAPVEDLARQLSLPRPILRALLPAISLAMTFYPARPKPEVFVQLQGDGALAVEYPWQPNPELVPALGRLFRRLGTLPLTRFARHAGPGQGIHYAGTLPIRRNPGPYQLHPDGRLHGTRAVYVCDGACFDWLPAKNLTYTIMANAHRIAARMR